MEDQKIIEILLKGHYVNEEDITKAKKFAKDSDVSAISYLLAEGLVTKDLVGQAVAESLGIPYADLNSKEPSKEQVLKIPEELGIKFRAVLFAEDKKTVTIASDNPKNKSLPLEMHNIFAGKEIKTAYSLPEDIDAVFIHYNKPLETRFAQIIKEKKRVAPEIIEEIFEDALTFKASDIHFEPQEKEVVVRFRVDGVLQEAGRIPKEYYESIINRVKVQAKLRIDEHAAAQDGSIRYRTDKVKVDLRISIIPTLDGEKIVIRILAEYIKDITLADLGLSAKHRQMIEDASKKPFGMILVTGPTGSGKTTTLYSVLKRLNKPDVNITTIEDPVEYKVPGINQIQVNTRTELTFAKGLRSIVRQDPDIILVGEIRDEETAEITVNAALTGHLLLSTFHANDAATAIPRLLDMSIEPFLLASTLEIIIAQRLVRKICDKCRYSVSVSQNKIKEISKDLDQYFPDDKTNLYIGKGCPTCGHTGYHGRTAIFELITITPEMEELILTSPSKQQIWKLAKEQGAISLFDDGVQKVKNGVTTLEELTRIAEPVHLS